MAILPSSTTSVVRYAAGLYGVKLGNATLQAVQSDLGANPLVSLPAVLNAYYAPFAGKTSAQVAAIVVANAGIVAGQYGLTATNVADAVAIVTTALNSAAPLGNQGVAISIVLAGWSNDSPSDPVYGAAATAWNLKIAQSTSYANAVGTSDTAFGAVVTEFRLSASGENRTGTEGDDTFIAVQGTFDNADRVNGGAGFDTLKAQVSTASNGVVAPNVSNVEHLQFQAQHRSTDSGDNNLVGDSSVKVDFNTNVTNVTGFTTIENNNSRADLIVEDVRIANNQITKDITIVMRETDPGNVDYGVYFDQNSLRNVSSSSSQINLRVLDTYAVSQGLAPLKDSPYGAFTFSFSKDGAAPVSVKLESAAIQNAQTFPEMVAALQAAANIVFGAGVVTVATGATYTVPDSVTGAQVQGTEIVLAAKGNISFSTPAGSGWLATETVPAISGLHTSYTVGGTTSSELVTSNIILDDVGRGSTGGDLVVGGLSVGETSTSKGVQKFLIEVQDNSKLQTIESTNNTLREVVLVNGVTDRVDNAYNDNLKDAGNLTVRGFEAPNDAVGNNALPGSKAALVGPLNNTFGFSDVRVIDGSAFKGKLDFDAEITSASIAKYLNLKDGAPALPAADNAAFVYSGGVNNDTIEVTVDRGVLAANNMLSGREDFSLTVNGGAGNDKITVDIAGMETANWYQNHKANKNLTVDAGDGDDVVTLTGAGAAKVLAGSGNDVVYLDNSGLATGSAAWMINSSANLVDPLVGANARGFLFNGKVTVAFSGAATGGGVTAGAADAVAAAFTNGFEVVADIPTGANYAVTQLMINQAIKKAINEDAVLKTLLKAEDGPASSLKITSLIDGVFAPADLQITVSSADLTTATAAQQATALAAYKAFAQDSAATIAAAQVANGATVVVANGASGMNTNQVLGATGGGVGTGTAAVAVTVQGVDTVAANAGTNEVATFTVSDLLAGESITINGLTITAAGGIATAASVEALLEAGVAGVNGFATATGANVAANWTLGVGAAGTVVYTSATAATNVADLAVTGTPGRGTMVTTTQGSAVVAGVGGVAEVFTATFTAMGAGEFVTLPNGTVLTAPVGGWTNAQVATAVAGVAAGVAGFTPVAGGAVVTYTATAPGVKADATNALFSFNATTGNSTVGTAESDNTVDLGAGTDVAVLGTGVNSNDTVVFSGYNLGKNTIVNFDDTALATGQDLLDFNAYLNGKTSLSGSTDSQREINITLNGDAVTEANSVTVLNGAFTATDTFAGLTAEKLLAAVNSTNTGTSNYAGIASTTLDALTTYTTAAGAANLVGGVGKAVVLVQNNANEGEYLAFELSFSGLAANANRDFTAAQLIGTVDFGNTVTFTQDLLVA